MELVFFEEPECCFVWMRVHSLICVCFCYCCCCCHSNLPDADRDVLHPLLLLWETQIPGRQDPACLNPTSFQATVVWITTSQRGGKICIALHKWEMDQRTTVLNLTADWLLQPTLSLVGRKYKCKHFWRSVFVFKWATVIICVEISVFSLIPSISPSSVSRVSCGKERKINQQRPLWDIRQTNLVVTQGKVNIQSKGMVFLKWNVL